MSNFLSKSPQTTEVSYGDESRQVSTTSGGLVVARFNEQSVWRGALRFPETPSGMESPLRSMARADNLNSGFFVDLSLQDKIPTEPADTALPESVDNSQRITPVWWDANGATTTTIPLATDHGNLNGHIISVRQSILPEFVTARFIDEVEINSSGTRVAILDSELPEEFFPLAPGTTFQYCVNRPHVRAIFTATPLHWQKNDPLSIQPLPINWVEDTGTMILGLREISGHSGIEPNVLVDPTGDPILDPTGDPILAPS